MRGSVGVIFGETGSHDFRFAISDSTAVRRGDYVKVWHESDGWVLCQVLSITRRGEVSSVDDAIDVANGEDLGAEQKIIAKATVIGSRADDGLLRAPRTPFSPGDRVFKADTDMIQGILGLARGDVYVGLLDGHDIPTKLDVNKLVQKHCSILAKTGSGKSYTAGVIVEELLERDVPLLILDPHGEYASLREANDEGDFEKYGVTPRDYADKITVYTPANLALNPEADKVFRLNGTNLGPRDLARLLPDDPSSSQMGIIYEAIQRLKRETDVYSLEDIIDSVRKDKSKRKWNVINALDELRETGLLSTDPTPVDELLRKNRCSIIDMRGVPPDLQGMVVSVLCEDLFEARKVGRVPPGMMIVEEAHNFCPERGMGKSASGDILRTIASEGRKFGLGLMVVSQRPARVEKNVLSQCNTQIIMKVTNPNDLTAIRKGLEGMTSEMEEEIQRLPPGVALLVSTEIERPVMVDVRARKSKHGGESVTIVKKKRKKATAKKSPAKKSSKTKASPSKPAVSRDSGDGESLFRKVFGKRD